MKEQRLMRVLTTATDTRRRSELPSCRNCGDRRPSQLHYQPANQYSQIGSFLTVCFRCKHCSEKFIRADWLTKRQSTPGVWFEVQEDLKGDHPILFHLSRRPATLPASPTEGA